MDNNDLRLRARRLAAALSICLFLFSGACRAAERMSAPPTAIPVLQTDTAPADTPTAPVVPSVETPPGTLQQPGSQLTPTTAATLPPLSCGYSPVTDALLEETTADRWIDWIEKLSGAEPVTIGGEEVTITTRYSPAMFSDQPHARAFDFVREQVLEWYPEDQVEIHDFTVTDSSNRSYTWQNLILTIPGEVKPGEVVILSAHLDSASQEDPEQYAPGAEDNGSGSAAILEAARILSGHHFERTIRIIWFTGEEQGLLGSSSYVEDLQEQDALDDIIGVVNLDMFGYDSDSDRCFEMHVGILPESDRVGRCFVDSIDAYGIDLPQQDYLTGEATDRSDHGSFWEGGVGAVEILENMFDNDIPNGCSNGDMNPDYHTPEDTVEKINPESGIAIVRAALATISAMAGPLE